MANRFTAAGPPPDDTGLRLSNGGTDVLFDVLTLAGCALAETAWEHHLVLHFADGHRTGRGTSGFDLSELPWTADWGDWRTAPQPELLARCPAHDLFQGELGCRLCDPDIQPIG